MNNISAESLIEQLDKARELAFANSEALPQVVRQILNFVNNPDTKVQRWCSSFLLSVFKADDEHVTENTKTELAMDSLMGLTTLSNVADLECFQHCIDTAVIVYKLVFKYAAVNDGCSHVWFKLNELKNSLISKFTTTFPLPGSDNEEHDQMRNIKSKLELLKFIIVVIDYQSGSNSNIPTFSVSKVNPNHTLIKHSVVEAEATGLLDLVLQSITGDCLLPSFISAVLNHLSVIVKKKPQYIGKILSVVEKMDTNSYYQSNFQSIEEFKLAKKYVDRALKIFISFVLRNNLASSNYQQSLNKKVSVLIDRGNDIRKKNIFSIEDPTIKKRKFEGFINSSKKLKTVDYKNLYCLIDSEDNLTNFDLTSVPQHLLMSMTLNALNRVSLKKLTKALEIISERYTDVIKSNPVKKEIKGEDDMEEDDEEENFNPQTVYTLPPPKDLSFDEKKEHVNVIIKNFFKLAQSNNNSPSTDEPVSDLTKVAIKSWEKESWFIILTRLATRGMRGVDVEESTDFKKNSEMSNLIREAIFSYFLEDIHGHIDLVIEWLNEEWYSEKVYNEDKLIRKLRDQYAEEDSKNVNQKIEQEVAQSEIPTPIYDKWASKVLDAMIPFLEPSDRKLFIRLLSDLPYLNEDLVSRIKSLCYDPGRSKIGFLSLQFLIMFRPPVKDACLNILGELGQSDQEDLKEEASKLLKKYTSQ